MTTRCLNNVTGQDIIRLCLRSDISVKQHYIYSKHTRKKKKKNISHLPLHFIPFSTPRPPSFSSCPPPQKPYNMYVSHPCARCVCVCVGGGVVTEFTETLLPYFVCEYISVAIEMYSDPTVSHLPLHFPPHPPPPPPQPCGASTSKTEMLFLKS